MEERLAKEVRLLFQSLDKKAQEKDDGDIYLLEGIGYYSRRTEKPVPPPEEDIHARIMREDEEDEENTCQPG